MMKLEMWKFPLLTSKIELLKVSIEDRVYFPQI